MVWARIDDSMMDHPKIVAAGPIAELIQVRAIQYCNRFLTDGFVPTQAVASLLRGMEEFQIPYGGVPDMFQLCHEAKDLDWGAIMVDAGLWTRRKDGYAVHDFLDYNRSKKDILAERNAKRQGGSKGAKSTNIKRWGSGSASTYPDTHADGSSSPPYPYPIEAFVLPNGSTPASAVASAVGEDLKTRGSGVAVPDALPTSRPAVTFRTPPEYLAALDRAPKLGRSAVLRRPEFWQAQLRAHPGVEFQDEVLKAEAWLTANPKRHIRDFPRFLHKWFARAYADSGGDET